MKQDLPPLPAKVPRKDRHLRAVPDLWIAQWLAGDALTIAERARLERLRAERRASQPEVPVGLLVGAEGTTGRQLDALIAQLRGARPTEIHHPGVAARLHAACKSLDVPVVVHRDVRRVESGMLEVIRLSCLVIAAPREMGDGGQRSPVWTRSPVWKAIKRAKDSNVPVRIVLPDGRVTGSERDST